MSTSNDYRVEASRLFLLRPDARQQEAYDFLGALGRLGGHASGEDIIMRMGSRYKGNFDRVIHDARLAAAMGGGHIIHDENNPGWYTLRATPEQMQSWMGKRIRYSETHKRTVRFMAKGYRDSTGVNDPQADQHVRDAEAM